MKVLKTFTAGEDMYNMIVSFLLKIILSEKLYFLNKYKEKSIKRTLKSITRRTQVFVCACACARGLVLGEIGFS